MRETTRLFLNPDLTPETVALTSPETGALISVRNGIDEFAEVLYKDYGQFFIFSEKIFPYFNNFF